MVWRTRRYLTGETFVPGPPPSLPPGGVLFAGAKTGDDGSAVPHARRGRRAPPRVARGGAPAPPARRNPRGPSGARVARGRRRIPARAPAGGPPVRRPRRAVPVRVRSAHHHAHRALPPRARRQTRPQAHDGARAEFRGGARRGPPRAAAAGAGEVVLRRRAIAL